MWKEVKLEEISNYSLVSPLVPFNKRYTCGGPFVIKTKDNRYFYNAEYEVPPTELGSYQWGYGDLKTDTDISTEKSGQINGSDDKVYEKYLSEITGLKVYKLKDHKGNYFTFENDYRIVFSTYSYSKANAFAKGYVCGKNS